MSMRRYSLRWCRFFTVSVITAVPILSCGAEEKSSNLAKDEFIQFFHTDAYRDENNPANWIIPIHGWVYEPQDSHLRMAAIGHTLKNTFDLDLTPASKPLFERRMNLMLSDNERDKTIVTNIAGRIETAKTTAANGHFHHTFTLPETSQKDAIQNGIVHYCAVLTKADQRQFCGQTRLIEPNGLSVISDIDDTVKISEVTERAKLIDNTFYKPFLAVPGMAATYTRWAQNGVVIHYVSSSPWYLYAELEDFFTSKSFPDFSMSLKYFRFRDATFFNLLKKGSKTKPPQIAAILNQYPGRKFVLIGDSGEEDPEVYTTVKNQHPDQIAHIYIRNISGETLANPRFAALINTLPAGSLTLFDAAEELPMSLTLTATKP